MRKTRSDKGTGSMGDRREYNRKYGLTYRMQQLLGIRRKKCECGGGIKGDGTPVKWIGGEGICQFCMEQESFSNAQAIRQRSTLRESNPARHDETERNARLESLPDWLRNWTETLRNRLEETMLTRVDCHIDDLGDELVVHAHGEYHLRLTSQNTI